MLHKDLMEMIVARGFVSVPPETSVFKAVMVMIEHNIGSLLVMAGKQFLGIVSERDIAWMMSIEEEHPERTNIQNIMTPAERVVTVTRHTNEDECLDLMREHNIRHLVVLEEGQVVGILSIKDLALGYKEDHYRRIRDMEGYLAKLS